MKEQKSNPADELFAFAVGLLMEGNLEFKPLMLKARSSKRYLHIRQTYIKIINKVLSDKPWTDRGDSCKQ